MLARLLQHEDAAEGRRRVRDNLTLARPRRSMDDEAVLLSNDGNALIAEELEPLSLERTRERRLPVTGVTRKDQGLALHDRSTGVDEKSSATRERGDESQLVEGVRDPQPPGAVARKLFGQRLQIVAPEQQLESRKRRARGQPAVELRRRRVEDLEGQRAAFR